MPRLQHPSRQVNGDSHDCFILFLSLKRWINTLDKATDLLTIRHALNKGVPFGGERWVDRMVNKHHLESTLRSAGRPKKQ